jgi:hypothetical protein
MGKMVRRRDRRVIHDVHFSATSTLGDHCAFSERDPIACQSAPDESTTHEPAADESTPDESTTHESTPDESTTHDPAPDDGDHCP